VLRLREKKDQREYTEEPEFCAWGKIHQSA
jgi:hypothetical protein